MTMRYSNDIDTIVQDSLNKLIYMKENSIPPFKKEVIEKYYNIYKNMIEEK